jgi:hypothetical protein
MPPKNIHTREYFSTDPSHAPHRDVETDSGPDEPSNSTTATEQKRITTSNNPEDDVVTVSKESTPSPTASDILLEFHLEDTMAATSLDRKWREEGVDAQERKRRLLGLQTQLNGERAAKERNIEEAGEEKGEWKGNGV